MHARCSVCGEPAVARVEYARKWFCGAHFAGYVEGKVLGALERYRLVERGWRVLAAVSGGADSAAMLGVLAKASVALGFRLAAVHVDLGIEGFSEASRRAVEELCGSLGVPLAVVSLPEVAGVGLPELARRARRPVCSVCGAVKRYLVNVAAAEAGADVVALGHHADDLLAYAVKNFLFQRLPELAKLGPKTESTGGLVGRVRPLYEVYKSEASLYARLSGLPFTEERCPYSPDRSVEDEVRAFLDSVEARRPGFKISLARGLARNAGLWGQGPRSPPRACRVCGAPSEGELCSFCRLTLKALGRPMGDVAREKVREAVSAIKW